MPTKTAKKVGGALATHHYILVAAPQVNQLEGATPSWLTSFQSRVAFALDAFLESSRSSGNDKVAERSDDNVCVENSDDRR